MAGTTSRPWICERCGTLNDTSVCKECFQDARFDGPQVTPAGLQVGSSYGSGQPSMSPLVLKIGVFLLIGVPLIVFLVILWLQNR